MVAGVGTPTTAGEARASMALISRLGLDSRPVEAPIGGIAREPVKRPMASSHNTLCPRSEASRTGVTSQAPRAPARAGVYGTKDGGLIITQHVGNQARGRPTEKALWHVKAAQHAVPSNSLAPPPGLPSRPPLGLALADQTQVVTQAVVGHVRAMLVRF